MAKSICTGCHETFNSASAFDEHRVGSFGDPIYSDVKRKKLVGYTPPARRCLNADEMQARGMMQNEKGRWILEAFHDTSRVRSASEVPIPDADELEATA